MEEELVNQTEEAAEEKEKSDGRSSLKKKVGRKALGAAAAVTTGTAVLVNGLFGSPDEMMKAGDEISKPAIVHVVDDISDEAGVYRVPVPQLTLHALCASLSTPRATAHPADSNRSS